MYEFDQNSVFSQMTEDEDETEAEDDEDSEDEEDLTENRSRDFPPTQTQSEQIH